LLRRSVVGEITLASLRAVQALMAPVAEKVAVNFLSPEELARKVFEETKEADPHREVYLQQTAQNARRDAAEARYHAVMADRKRRQDARVAEQRMKTEKARAEKAKRKKMKKRGR
jgi:hypothetical protein